MADEKVRGDGYYRWFPGDYQRDTADLSMTEDGAYRRLLDFYYSEEHLPADASRLYRIARAMSTQEQAAVDHVVSRFFRTKKDRLFNKRAEREIEERKRFLSEQSRKGRLSGESRRQKHKEKDTEPETNPGSTPVQPRHEPEGEPKVNQASASASASASALPPATPPAKDQSQEQARRAKHRPAFTPPTVDEVRTYCNERGNNIDPELFVESNTAKGWVIGKNRSPAKDWEAMIRTWELREKEKPNGRGNEQDRGEAPSKSATESLRDKYAGIGETIIVGGGKG